MRKGIASSASPSTRQVNTTPIALDLTKPDKSKIKTWTEYDDGLIVKEYSSKEGRNISSVVTGEVEVWSASGDGEECTFVQSYAKEDSILVTVLVRNNGHCTEKYFEKVNGTWSSISEEEFLKEFYEMRMSGLLSNTASSKTYQ
ncbi:hypothetical protein BEWA_024420 [Theileria equi strain WA]|uniref:Signal peptide containing protein n=1 Tax=Theileria equi strain WA TaxID=1537102 RepID=L0AWG5_THEEQ|nr:hypothetical protein BEWA_024420 [Theileria equi strain WA]AFZ79593.1 hypothetical protein BEWA_024420 [Theileria equi strain WA]|eukprot:XP_004829259.1 hypothetical protein BEWA_024420 [Theileria equi strain WA]